MSTFGLAILLSIGLVAGCGIFSPDKDDGDGPDPPLPVVYHVPFDPTLALENMRLAYQARDSVQADSVYHPDYHGESSTAVDPIGTLVVLTKAQEVSHVGALRKAPEVTDITVNMGGMSTWRREASLDLTHPEWASITISSGIRVEITAGSTLYTVGNDDFFEFQFAPTTPAAASPTDTLWQIVRWREIKGAGGS